jgi:hypothetical protein
VLLLGEDETESAISSEGGLLGGVMNSGELPGGGAASSDVLRLALMHFHSLFRRKLAMPAVIVETIAIPIWFAISYPMRAIAYGARRRRNRQRWSRVPKRNKVSHFVRENVEGSTLFSGGGIDGL